ncbi:glycosyltransferase [Phenylobacterium sp.]|uniref:glycosyltransferase family 2 protein n=1 Tax=Phenylobacterium sp. TaxID=1871053 RepID=UPI00301C2084
MVIPARGEGSGLAACLTAILWDAGELNLRVVLVLNGEGQAEAAAVAASLGVRFEEQGHELRVLVSAPGKFHALNAAEAFRRRVPVVYLDADVVPAPGLLSRLHAALNKMAEPLLAGPRLFIAHDSCRAARAFGSVWHTMPAVRNGVIGGGCYAVNQAGRSLWGAFPPITGDDAFVCARFAGERQAALPDAAIFVHLPQGWRNLVETRTRWLRSAREGRMMAGRAEPEAPAAPKWNGTGARSASRLSLVLTSPQIWRHLPGFLAVEAIARAKTACRTEQASGWTPKRTPCHTRILSSRPRIHVVIVSHNSERDLSACLGSIRSSWAELTVTVFDNASNDRSATIAETHRSVQVIRSTVNLGFAVAVNRAVASKSEDVEWILLLNPDARIEPDAIDMLLAASLRYPDGGVFGGLGRTPDGLPIPSSCLDAPSVWSALCYAVGLRSGLGKPRAVRQGSRQAQPTPAVSGAFMLIAQEAWQRAGGFDERYFLYGEDVDLCLRIGALGRRTISVGAAGYLHVGSASSSSRAKRRMMMIRGVLTLYATHARGPLELSQGLIRIGVLLRVAAKAITDASAREVLRRRNFWWRGYSGEADGMR